MHFQLSNTGAYQPILAMMILRFLASSLALLGHKAAASTTYILAAALHSQDELVKTKDMHWNYRLLSEKE